MNIHMAAHYAKVGYRIIRAEWKSTQSGHELTLKPFCAACLLLEDLLAEDWEIVPEKENE